MGVPTASEGWAVETVVEIRDFEAGSTGCFAVGAGCCRVLIANKRVALRSGLDIAFDLHDFFSFERLVKL